MHRRSVRPLLSAAMRFSVAAVVAAAVIPATALPGLAQTDGSSSTYRVILYIAENAGPQQMSIRRLDQVWDEGDGTARLRELLQANKVEQLEEVTVLPNRDTPALSMGGVTVRVRGAYREPRKDAMFLRVELEGGQETLVKEMISKFDESIVVAYPLAEGGKSLVALIVPTQIGN